jgi:hypothetical protein
MNYSKTLISPERWGRRSRRVAASVSLGIDTCAPRGRSSAHRIRPERFAVVFFCLCILISRAFGQVSHTIQISNDADDGYYNQDDSSGWHSDPQYGNGSADLVGSDSGITAAWTSGYRFPATGVNSGDTIRSAYLQLVSSDSFASSVTCGSAPCADSNYTFRVYGVAQDDGSSFSNTSGNTPLTVPYTTSYVDYTTTGPGDVHGSCQGNNSGQDTCTHTIDVTNIVKEITSRPGWTNGSAIRFVLISTNASSSGVYAGFEDYAANPAKAATLLINPPLPTIVSSGGWGTESNPTYPTSYPVGPFVYPGASAIFLMLEDYYTFYNQSIGQPTVSDNCGNTWNILAGPTNLQSINYYMRATVYYVQSPAYCPAGDTITINVPVQEPIFLHFYAVAGSNTSQTPVASAIATSPTNIYTTSATTNSVSLAGAGQLLSWIIGDSDASTTFTPQPGFVADVNSIPTYVTGAFENVSAAGTYQNTWSISPSDGWETVLVGVPAASGSAAAATVTVSASPTTINQTQDLTVTITVSGTPTPSGSVTLTGGGYTSSATALSGGVATINVPAGSLSLGVDELSASYTPDSGSSAIYTGGTGSTSVTVAQTSTPGMTVNASPASINPTQGTSVTVTVSGTPTPTGSVTLTGGGYTSAATALSGGVATINIPAGSLSGGMDTLTATYTPDSNSSSIYSSATGTTSVTVTTFTPSVTVTPSASSITTVQVLPVIVTVSGGNGNPTATGSVTLSGGGYTSAATSLSGGTATINIPAGSLSVGMDTLTVSYTPDSNSVSIYSSATGANSVTVAVATPTVTVTPASNSITIAQPLSVTVSVSGGAGSPTATGFVVLSGGSYTSAAIPLTGGAATINIPAGTLTAANYSFKATYTPDAGSSSIYAGASGTASAAVIVSVATPTVTVTPSSNSITTTQPLSVTVSVNGGTGDPTATGSVTLSGGSYTSAATALTGGTATINIPAGTLTAANYTFKATYTPDAGSSSIYAGASGTASAAVVVGAATPTVTVTPSTNRITIAQPLSVTVSVSGGNSNPTATGSVTLSGGSYTSAASTLTGGTATINIPAGTLTAANYTFSATYTPDAGSSSIYATASGTASAAVVVGVAVPAVMVTPSASSITTAQPLSVTVSVNGGSGDPTATGSVTLSGGSYTSAATTLTGGTATINIPGGTLTVGNYTFKANYTPDAGSSSIYDTASGTALAAVAVGSATPAVTVIPSSNSITTVQALSVTVTVSGAAGEPTATGSVTLVGGGYISAATALTGGTAIINIPAGTLTAASYTFKATYTPDAGSSSIYVTALGTASAAVVVGVATPSVVVTPSLTSITSSQSLSVTVTVSGGVGDPTATGSVTLSGGSYISAATTVSGGAATINIPAGTLSSGSYTFKATYTPDAGSSSIYASAMGTASVVVAVGLATPAVTVTPSSNSISASQALTVTVTVAGTPTPTGSVTLSGGSYTSAATALSGGSAAIIIPGGTLSSGSYTFKATYTPDSNSASTYASSSGTASVVVAVGVGTPTITVTPASQTLNSNVSLNVTVSITGTAVTPTGMITLSGGGITAIVQTIGTSPCTSASSCVFTIPANSLNAGTDTLTASYSGDANNTGGSNTAQVTVTESTFSLNQTAIAITPSTATTTGIAPGSSATAVVTISALSGYTGTVSLGCTQNSSTLGGDGTTCTGGGSGAQVNLATCGANCSVTFTITTKAPQTAALERPKIQKNDKGWLGAGGGAIFALLVFFGIPARRRSWRAMLGILVVTLGLGALSGCGGGSGGNSGGGSTDAGTTAGTYTYTVTATPNPSVNPPVTTTFQVVVN